MNPCGDKLATTRQTAPSTPVVACREPKRKGKGKPVAMVGFGSAKVPVYRCVSAGRIRFAISYHRDGMSERYIGQLRSSLGQFSRACPGPIMDVQPVEIDAWLRGGDLAPVTRNNRLTVLRVLFGFAKQRNYLPETESTAPERMSKVKVRNDD